MASTPRRGAPSTSKSSGSTGRGVMPIASCRWPSCFLDCVSPCSVRPRGLALVRFEVAKPDVAKPDEMAVILQRDWEAIGVTLVRRAPLERRRTRQHRVVLNKHAVVQHRHPCWTRDLAGGVEARAV